MVKEGKRAKPREFRRCDTASVSPFISVLGISFKYMEDKYMQRGTLCCEIAQTLANGVNEIIYQGANTTLGTAGSVCECLPGPRSTWAAAQGEQRTDRVVAVAGRWHWLAKKPTRSQPPAEFGFCLLLPSWGTRHTAQPCTLTYPFGSKAVKETSSTFWPWTSDQQVSSATHPDLPAGCWSSKRCYCWWFPFLNTQGIRWVLKSCKMFPAANVGIWFF